MNKKDKYERIKIEIGAWIIALFAVTSIVAMWMWILKTINLI